MRISPPISSVLSAIDFYHNKPDKRANYFIIYQVMINIQGEIKSWETKKKEDTIASTLPTNFQTQRRYSCIQKLNKRSN